MSQCVKAPISQLALMFTNDLAHRIYKKERRSGVHCVGDPDLELRIIDDWVLHHVAPNGIPQAGF